ncbi:uncharacterized protein ACO6RY_15788 [Pungitius sinensis]
MIGRADIEGSKSDVAMNAWPPQASYPCGVPPQSNSPPATVPGAGHARASRAFDTRIESPLGALLPASPGKWKNDKSSGISPAAEASHLFYTSHVSSQCQTRVKLNRVFFPR